MKLVTFQTGKRQNLGIIANQQVYDLHECDPMIPGNMNAFLQGGDRTK